jgi:predicted phage baseplate assembly protein
VIDLGASGPDDRHYVLDAEAGSVRFGDGMRGRIPERGARIRVQRMRAGGGPDGNLPAGKLAEVRGALAPDGSAVTVKLAVEQPLPTRGGRAAETIAQGEQRIAAWLRHRNRAVTEQDYRALALSTPGVSVGRVELLPRFKPHQRRSGVPGVVTVMVLPQRRVAAPAPPNPRVDRPLLESVHGFLDARRPLGTELYVVGPEYVPLAASVAVRLRDGAEREQTLSAVKQAIGAFLWPLSPGGPAGEGWPLGAQVVNREVEVAVARVGGVAAVSDVKLFERSGDGWKGLPQGTKGSPQVLTLQRWQLPELLSVVVTVGETAPSDPTRLPNPFADGATSVAVPVVPEVC